MITENEDKDIFNKIKINLERCCLPIPRHVKEEEMNIFD